MTATGGIITSNHKTKTLSDFYSQLRLSGSFTDLKQQITKIVNHQGVSDYTFVPLERDWDYESQKGVLSTLPDEYWRIFREEELYEHDMLVSFFRENSHPSHTSHIYNFF